MISRKNHAVLKFFYYLKKYLSIFSLVIFCESLVFLLSRYRARLISNQNLMRRLKYCLSYFANSRKIKYPPTHKTMQPSTIGISNRAKAVGRRIITVKVDNPIVSTPRGIGGSVSARFISKIILHFCDCIITQRFWAVQLKAVI